MVYSIEIDKYNPTALTYCLNRLENGIPNYAYDWRITVNAGGIDYGVYLNVDIENKIIEICNQSESRDKYGLNTIEEVLDYFEKGGDNDPE